MAPKLTEQKMAKLVVLPAFLITIEDYNQIKDPPLRNLKQSNENNQYSNQQVISYRLNDDFVKRNKKVRPFKEYCCGAKEFLQWVFFIILLVFGSYFIMFKWNTKLTSNYNDYPEKSD